MHDWFPPQPKERLLIYSNKTNSLLLTGQLRLDSCPVFSLGDDRIILLFVDLPSGLKTPVIMRVVKM